MIPPADKELIGRKVVMCGEGIKTERGDVLPGSHGRITDVRTNRSGDGTCLIDWEPPAHWPIATAHWGMPARRSGVWWFILLSVGFCGACEAEIEKYPEVDYLCESCRANG